MMQLTKSNTLNKALSLALCALLAGSLLPFLPIKAYAAGEVPGTPEYYDARWEDAKVAAGYKEVGTTYTDHTGAAATTTNAGPWELNLDWGNTCSRPWNGTAVAPTTTTTVYSYARNAYTAYEVYTAEQFVWCTSRGLSFKLKNDIDLNGYSGQNYLNDTSFSADYVADGAGHTIYNYYCRASYSTSAKPSIFGRTSSGADTTIKNIVISNYYQNSLMGAVLANRFLNGTIFNVKVQKGCLLAATQAATITTETRGYYPSIINTSCDNTHVRGEVSCSSNFVETFTGLIKNSYSINGTINVANGHSGGMNSCSQGDSIMENCFADIDCYGNQVVGVIDGSIEVGAVVSPSNQIRRNCYATGTVEGTHALGGFTGQLEPFQGFGTLTVRYENCYSTAMVGMLQGGSNLGSFVGNESFEGFSFDNKSYLEANRVICSYDSVYGAGEVGSIDTDSFPGRTTFTDVGGFVALSSSPNTTRNNCYYDKQTTAMREWSTGNGQNGTNIKGVLTTDSNKSGTGLTSTPNSNVAADGSTGSSFTGFSNNGDWVFVKEHYPQLKVFAHATRSSWGYPTDSDLATQGYTSEERALLTSMYDETIDQVKASSAASTSTVGLNTWDEDYAGNALPNTTYDTVRDVVAPAPLTNTDGVDWTRCGVTGADTLATGTGATTDVFGTTKDVITVQNDPVKGWQIKDPYPGVDWLRATTTVGGQRASRAFRVCPTVGLDPGASKTIDFNTTYDHADDMRMLYSTGARYSANTQDMTYGVYPDVPLATGQDTLLGTGGLQNKAALTALYAQAGQNDTYANINVGNMQRTSADIASYPAATTNAGNTLNTIIKKGADPVDLNTVMGQKFNGNLNFTKADAGDYEISYYWSLNDGRFLTGTKLLNTPPLPPNANLKIKKTVQGAAKDTFNFEVVLTDAQGKAVNVPAGQPAGVMVSGNKATFGLKKGQEVILTGIETGTKATITETKHDGYSVLIKDTTAGGAVLSRTNTAQVTINNDQAVEVINNPGVELPKAGATPPVLLTLFGLIALALVPVCIGIRLKRVRERGA